MKSFIEWTRTGYIERIGDSKFVLKPSYLNADLSEKFEGTITVENKIKDRIELRPFRVVDLNDNELGLAFTIEKAREIFRERYIYWEGGCDMFIEENKENI